jgi:hypothetical protein
MDYNKYLEYLIIISVFIATFASLYIFIETVVFKKRNNIEFYNRCGWQLPMLIALLIDAVGYNYIRR